MQLRESHGRLEIGRMTRWGTGLLVLCAIWLASQLWMAHQEQASWARSQETSAVARNLYDRINERIDALKNQAISLGELQRQSRFSLLPEKGQRGLVYWGEWKFESRELAVWAEHPRLPEAQRAWIRQMQEQVPWAALRESPSAMVRGANGEWVAFYFKNGNAVLGTLVDPALTFAISLQEMHLLPGPSSPAHAWRAYVISEDGKVLAHSHPAFNGADFSQAEVYREGLSGSLRGGRPGGVGKYRGVDDVAVTAAYARMAPFALGVAVELNESQPIATSAVAPSVQAMQSRAFGQVFLVIAIAALAVGFFWFSRSRKLVALRDAEAEYFERQLDQLENAALAASSDETPAPPVLTDDTLILSEVRPDDRTVHTTSSSKQASGADSQIDSQIVENALYQELQCDPAHSRENQGRRIRISRLESELSELAEFLDDEHISRLFAERLTIFMSGLVHAPALYFRVHSPSDQAILEAVEGLDPMDSDLIQGGLAFPLIPELIGRAQGTALRGSIFPMTDYAPLANLIRLQFAGSSYQSWAVQGKGNGEIYGVLVIVAEEEQIREESEAIARVIRSTGQLYDHAALSTKQ